MHRRLQSFGLASLLLASTGLHAAGPDVTVLVLSDTANYGAENGIRGYSVGTTSCNIGDAPLNWCSSGGCAPGASDSDHPVIAQNLYRLKNGRMDQIGASWLKHGFFSVNSQAVNCRTGSCQQPPAGGAQLGVGCTDPYGSGLNGSRPLGRRSQVDPSSGLFPNPAPPFGDDSTTWNQRVAVAEGDLLAALNPDARYFVEGQYIARDDAAAGNGLNNASYREVSVTPGSHTLQMVAPTVPQAAAVQAWAAIDADVELINVDVPSDPLQRFHVARKVTVVKPGTLWHYEYAIHNLNSERAADRFEIEFPGVTSVTAIGFHDVNAHSGEPYDTRDWLGSTGKNTVSWEALEFPSAPGNANALRWATLYNFWFNANRPPQEITTHRLRLFTPGSPAQLEFGIDTKLFEDGFEN